jgi:hypothetical protein
MSCWAKPAASTEYQKRLAALNTEAARIKAATQELAARRRDQIGRLAERCGVLGCSDEELVEAFAALAHKAEPKRQRATSANGLDSAPSADKA